ncbi:MAG: hypothetical protein U5L95_00715 [Candidatus Saccharibacteria bacterium]|nr:hypothetical protein [Candidatus Saccharibacteria bacterium]
MKNVAFKIKPKSGFSYFVHLFFVAFVPTMMYITVRIDLIPVALLIVLLGKWRVFAVRPRHWWPYLRANAVDMMVGLSTLGAMVETSSGGMQALLAVLYGLWLLLLKPRSTPIYVSLQALLAQTSSLIVLFLLGDGIPLALLVLAAGAIGYLSARHFLANFDEAHAPLYAHSWGYFCAALTWVLGHWTLYYVEVVAQIAVLLTCIGFSLAALYYLERKDKLSTLIQRQILFLMIAVTVVVIVFSDWGDQAI